MVESAVIPNPVPGVDAPPVVTPPAVPEKFQKADGTVDVNKLAESYAALEDKLGTDGAKKAVDGDDNATPKLDADGKPIVEPKLDADGKPIVESKLDADGKPVVDPDEFKDATYGKVVDEALTAAGLTPAGVATEFATDGVVSEATYTALDTAGFPKALVDQYVAGFKANAAATAAAPVVDPKVAQAETVLADKQVSDIKESVGGGAQYDQMMEWAKTLPAAEVDTFNRLTGSGDLDVVKSAVAALHGRFVAAEGSEGRTIMGGGVAGGDVYESAVAASKAITDARKTGDPAIIRAVELKMLRSNVFA